jgi:hypothetical protein
MGSTVSTKLGRVYVVLTLAMQRILKAVQNLSGFSRTVPFAKSKQREFFKYTSGRWLYNEEKRERIGFALLLF